MASQLHNAINTQATHFQTVEELGRMKLEILIFQSTYFKVCIINVKKHF